MTALRCLAAMAVLVQLSFGLPVNQMSTIEKIDELENKLDHVDVELNRMLKSKENEVMEQELDVQAQAVANAMGAAENDEERQAILEAATANLEAMSVDDAVDVAEQFQQMQDENMLETGESDEAEEEEYEEDEDEHEDEEESAEEQDYNADSAEGYEDELEDEEDTAEEQDYNVDSTEEDEDELENELEDTAEEQDYNNVDSAEDEDEFEDEEDAAEEQDYTADSGMYDDDVNIENETDEDVIVTYDLSKL